jgi:hypothetical protein
MTLRHLPILRLALAGLILTTLAFGPLHGAAAPKKPAPPDPRILISKVDVANQEVVFNYKRTNKMQTYKIDDLTAVTVSGSPAALKDIKVGLQVVDYIERDGDTLDKITVETPDAAPK